MQCASICARVGSVTGLKAGSQPSRVCMEVGSSVELCWMGWSIGSWLPLEVRLTEMVTPAALSALLELVNPVMAPAMKQLKREAAAISLSLSSNVQRMAFFRGIGCGRFKKKQRSIPTAPQIWPSAIDQRLP